MYVHTCTHTHAWEHTQTCTHTHEKTCIQHTQTHEKGKRKKVKNASFPTTVNQDLVFNRKGMSCVSLLWAPREDQPASLALWSIAYGLAVWTDAHQHALHLTPHWNVVHSNSCGETNFSCETMSRILPGWACRWAQSACLTSTGPEFCSLHHTRKAMSLERSRSFLTWPTAETFRFCGAWRRIWEGKGGLQDVDWNRLFL